MVFAGAQPCVKRCTAEPELRKLERLQTPNPEVLKPKGPRTSQPLLGHPGAMSCAEHNIQMENELLLMNAFMNWATEIRSQRPAAGSKARSPQFAPRPTRLHPCTRHLLLEHAPKLAQRSPVGHVPTGTCSSDLPIRVGVWKLSACAVETGLGGVPHGEGPQVLRRKDEHQEEPARGR